MLDFAPRLRDTLSRGFLIGGEIAHAKAAKDGEEKFEMRNSECGNSPSAAPNLADSGGALEGLRKKVLKERNFLGFRWFNLI
jgi:hypothetical protein